jgi:hypothetical protein
MRTNPLEILKLMTVAYISLLCATILIMPKLVTLIFFIGLTTLCNAQGSWNIGYIEVDSISKEHVGRVVRVDLKSNNPFISPDGNRCTRSYVGAKDTAELTIDTTLFILTERREIYVDHGDYNKQFLECINCGNVSIQIYDSKILEVDQMAIIFQLDIEIENDDKVKRKETKIIKIDRNLLDGVMYKL